MTFQALYMRVFQVLDMTLGLLVGLAVLVFFWGIIQYVIAQGDQKKLDEGKKVMIYGVIGLTVMVSVWGIVNLLTLTLFGASATDPFFFNIPFSESTGNGGNLSNPDTSNQNLDMSPDQAADQAQSCKTGYVWSSLLQQCTSSPDTFSPNDPANQQTPGDAGPITCALGSHYDSIFARCVSD